ncbi:hypothetical protein BDV11DRAFT_182179 [Aspergillus similis]
MLRRRWKVGVGGFVMTACRLCTRTGADTATHPQRHLGQRDTRRPRYAPSPHPYRLQRYDQRLEQDYNPDQLESFKWLVVLRSCRGQDYLLT